MSVRVIRWVVVFLSVSLPAVTLSQQPSTETEPSAPVPGSAISIPLPEIDPRLYEVPELSGAEGARGSFLVNGNLPRPIADYWSAVGKIQQQRISIFENGIVSMTMLGVGGTIRKKLLLPPDALQRYREALSAEALVEEPQATSPGPTADRALLRIYRDDGSYVERRFNPTLVQSATMHKPLTILNDLLRALSEDREVTNTLTGYIPRVGDQLIADDEQIYRVVRIINDGQYLELMSTREPLTLYIATKDLHNYFIGRRKVAKPDQ